MTDTSTSSQRNALSRASAWIYQELGLSTVWFAPRDAHFILVSRFTRVFAYGSSTLILALYFSVLGFAPEQIGLFMTLTLLGDVLVSLVLALWADRLGRRRMLMLGGLMMAGSGVVFATTGNYWILLAAAVLGVISPGCVLETLCRHDFTVLTNGNIVAMKSARSELSKNLPLPNSSLLIFEPTSSPGKIATPLLLFASD
jgi:MFS family permease